MTLHTHVPPSDAIPTSLKPRSINRLLAGEESYRHSGALFQNETQLFFEVIRTQTEADKLIDAMEALRDYSDPCPFHEWVQYGLDETAGRMVTVSDTSGLCGFVVFVAKLEIDSSNGIDKVGLFGDLERLYVGAAKRNMGLGKGLVAAVASAPQSVLKPVSSETEKGPNIRFLTLYLSGDSLSPSGDRLMKILTGAITKQAFSLIHSAQIAEFRIQDMTASLHRDDEE
jgi:hypothetical protein